MTSLRMAASDLGHQRVWLRRLARSLLRGDSAAAEDATQETLAAALEHPPPDPGNPRPWLASILRNLLKQGFRGEGRRRAREAQVAIAADAASVDDVVERHEMQRRLAALVSALDEPFQSTVLFRYVEDLTPTEIARRQGVPAGTVRWRLKTALDRLRARIDETERGGRAAFLIALTGGHERAASWTAATLAAVALTSAGVLTISCVVMKRRPPPTPQATPTVQAPVKEPAANEKNAFIRPSTTTAPAPDAADDVPEPLALRKLSERHGSLWGEAMQFIDWAIGRPLGPHEMFQDENRHETWAPRMESILRDRFAPHILAGLDLQTLELRSVECHTSMCRIEVEYPADMGPGHRCPKRDRACPLSTLWSNTGLPALGATGGGQPDDEIWVDRPQGRWVREAEYLYFSEKDIDPSKYLDAVRADRDVVRARHTPP